ncbi:DapH/DapD/GlmU-related protein [Haloarchaeobius baliensis]|uniref:acyltransferase n=1 Tax=Haloarchaeobius baliensis TaxID=1670458 RepID=UPI003F88320C
MEDDAEQPNGVTVHAGATLGVSYDTDSEAPTVGEGSVIRSGTILYNDVTIGKRLQTGHHALIREQTVIGDDSLVGTQTVIDGETDVGDSVSMQTGVYIPRNTTIGDRVFLGPKATLLNDMFPVRSDYELTGPTLRDDVSVGANATILPDVTIGENAFIAAGAVVTEDVPPRTLAAGVPATHQTLPEELTGGNDL